MTDSLGIYISVPFCKAKCSYCNFASGVFAVERMDRYVDRVCAEMRGLQGWVQELRNPMLDKKLPEPRLELPEMVDSIFFGGGTPSLLSAQQMQRLFDALRGEFEVSAGAEVTLECAPGQLADGTLDELLRQGMNRVSFGVQSFVDREAAGVGRLHTRAMCLDEIARMRAAGVQDINVDLIAGLPHQTAESWRESVEVAQQSGVPHVSVYMLEVDEDSRLGREMLASGAKYGAADVACEDEIAERYSAACEWLEAGGVRQYEISNFARERHRSRHNMKYWRREPYVGFGLDAHSMLRSGRGAIRWANGDQLDTYLQEGDTTQGSRLKVLAPKADEPAVEVVGTEKALEEAMFLGLRMNDGMDLKELRAMFGEGLMHGVVEAMGDVEEAGLIAVDGDSVRLTARGRMASNEVFSHLLVGVVVQS